MTMPFDPSAPWLTPGSAFVVTVAYSPNEVCFNKATSAPSWLRAFTASSRRLSTLPEGWDGPGSVPASKNALYKAERITRDALAGLPDAFGPYLVPAGNGSVQVEWHGNIAEIELTIDASGGTRFWCRDYETGTEREGEDEEARSLFLRWAPWLAAAANDGADEAVPSTADPLTPGYAVRPVTSVA